MRKSNAQFQGGPGTERGTGTVGTVFPEPNAEPEPPEPFSQEPNAEPEPPEPFSQEPKPEPEPSSLLHCTETQEKDPSLEEPREPKTGTAPSPNRNRTEPNRGQQCIIFRG